MKTGYDMERHKLLKILEKKEYGYWKWSWISPHPI
jgi:hypothetical protein